MGTYDSYSKNEDELATPSWKWGPRKLKTRSLRLHKYRKSTGRLYWIYVGAEPMPQGYRKHHFDFQLKQRRSPELPMETEPPPNSRNLPRQCKRMTCPPRTAILLYLVSCMGGAWLLEQPSGSVMAYHPRIKQLFRKVGRVARLSAFSYCI